MADVFKSFHNTVNTVTYGLGGTRSNPVSGRFAKGNSTPASGGFFGSKPSTTTVKENTGGGLLGFLFDSPKSEKSVHVEPNGNDRAAITVKDYTGAGAYATWTGDVPEQRYIATKVGDKVVLEKTASAGDSWWALLTNKLR